MKKNKGTILICTGLLLIAAALFLTAYNLFDEVRAGNSAKDLADRLREQIVVTYVEGTDKSYLQPDGTPAEIVELPAYVQNPDMEMPVEILGDYAYIGLLEIPSLGLELPIIENWSYPALKVAPCRYTGSVYKDNMIISAHNYKTHFGLLDQLKGGERVIFTDMEGNEFFYEVIGTEILEPTAIEEMKGGDWPLTLFTCTLGGQSRVTVRCDKVR